MITLLLAFSGVTFAFAMLLNIPTAAKAFRNTPARQKAILVAWCSMFIGQLQVFSREAEALEGLAGVGGGQLYQIMWMLIAGGILLYLVLSSTILPSAWRYPLVAFIVYCFLAIASSAFSPSPLLSLYKSAQIVMDALLVIVTCSELIRKNAPQYILNVTVVLLALMLFIVVLGGVLFPELAFRADTGALGGSLTGVIFHIHPNELGLMAAIALVIGLIRTADPSYRGRMRFFWMALLVMSLVVLFLAQARTSLGGSLIALIMSGFLIKRLRWIASGIFILALSLVFYYQLSGKQLGIEDTVEHYVTRGVSDEKLRTLSGRTVLYQLGWRMFQDAPLFGHGYAAGARMAGEPYGIPYGTNMHSGHMQVLVDVGGLGYLAWLAFVVGTGVLVIRVVKRSATVPVDRYPAVEAALIVFVIVFRSFLGHVLVSHQPNLMIFFAVYIYAAVKLATYANAARDPASIPVPVPAATAFGASVLARKRAARLLNTKQ